MNKSDLERVTQPAKNATAADRARVAATLNKLQPAKNTSYESSDIGDGRLFADVFKDRARFVPERKSWFVYCGFTAGYLNDLKSSTFDFFSITGIDFIYIKLDCIVFD